MPKHRNDIPKFPRGVTKGTPKKEKEKDEPLVKTPKENQAPGDGVKTPIYAFQP